jgi:hypothetical protein
MEIETATQLMDFNIWDLLGIWRLYTLPGTSNTQVHCLLHWQTLAWTALLHSYTYKNRKLFFFSFYPVFTSYTCFFQKKKISVPVVCKVLTLLSVLKPFCPSIVVTRSSDKPIKFDCLALLHVHAWTFNYHRMVPSLKERKWFSIDFHFGLLASYQANKVK